MVIKMRARTFLTALFALSLAIAGFAFLSSMAKKSDADEPKQQILATTMELPTGTLLRAQDIKWQTVATVEADEIARPATTQVDIKPEIVEETAASVYGAVLRRPLTAGEPIRRGDIVKPGDRDFLQVVLSPGARAIAIPVTTGGASTGLLTAGDRVDVVLTQNFRNENTDEARNAPLTRRSVGETIVQNLRVLAIDSSDTPKTTNLAAGSFGRTVTLEVTPEQAETVNVAQELGKLTVTLRGGSNSNQIARNSGNQIAANDGIAPTDDHAPITPKWAGDVSPALTSTIRPPKAVAVKMQPVTVIRGHTADKDLRYEIVKPEGDTKGERDR